MASGCTVQFVDGSPSTVQSQTAFYGRPVHGEFLCLSAVSGMPIYSRPGLGADIIGYTRRVVAFAGMQQGGQIMIITYNGLNGWIDGTKIAPYRDARGRHCTVPGRDFAQRPIFEID